MYMHIERCSIIVSMFSFSIISMAAGRRQQLEGGAAGICWPAPAGYVRTARHNLHINIILGAAGRAAGGR